MDVNSRDRHDGITEPPRPPPGATKPRLMNPTLHLLARRSPPVPDCDDSESPTESRHRHARDGQNSRNSREWGSRHSSPSPALSTNSVATTDDGESKLDVADGAPRPGGPRYFAGGRPHEILVSSSGSDRENLSSAGSSTGSISCDGDNEQRLVEEGLFSSCPPSSETAVTPRVMTRASNSSALELRTLSPPLPLLERKVARPSEKPLDFRGKVPSQPTSPNRPDNSAPGRTEVHRAKQSHARDCLMRSLSRALSTEIKNIEETALVKESADRKSGFHEDGKEASKVFDIMNHHLGPAEGSDSLTFDSRFESGNLRKACRISPRTVGATPHGRKPGTLPVLQVDQEYDLWSSNDIHTRGNTQWFYFCAGENENTSKRVGAARKNIIVKKGLTVRFNIVNMRKSDSLCNFGMRPVVLSMNSLAEDELGWIHDGAFLRFLVITFCVTSSFVILVCSVLRATCFDLTSLLHLRHPNTQTPTTPPHPHVLAFFFAGEDVCYYRNFCGKSGGKKGGRSLYSLSFVYTFRSDGDRVYFAYNFPYTFTRLQRFIRQIEKDPVRQKVFRRRLLCRTLSGNACDVLTVTAPIRNNEELARRKIVIVSARVHPGETVASWMMHGLIEFITGNSEIARALRGERHF